MAAATTSFDIVQATAEFRVLSANPALMAQLAETSGGQTLAANDLRSLPDRVAQWQAEQQLVDKQSPLWDRGWLLLLAVGLLGIEWYSRRREGLL